MNLYQAIRDALGWVTNRKTELTIRTALATNPKAIVYGEDVAFGGVFVGRSIQEQDFELTRQRCTMGLTEEFGQCHLAPQC
jgi:2-oxoisovalerate dehydrogenase E1 component beta subunit